MNTDDTVISVTGLTKRFGTFTAVDNISFDVCRGEIFRIRTASGFPKSCYNRHVWRQSSRTMRDSFENCQM